MAFGAKVFSILIGSGCSIEVDLCNYCCGSFTRKEVFLGEDILSEQFTLCMFLHLEKNPWFFSTVWWGMCAQWKNDVFFLSSHNHTCNRVFEKCLLCNNLYHATIQWQKFVVACNTQRLIYKSVRSGSVDSCFHK